MRTVNFSIDISDTMPLDVTLRRMKKHCAASGLFRDLKQRSFYTPPGKARRLKSLRARKRARKQKDYWAAERIAYLDRNGLPDPLPTASSRTGFARTGIA